jgi:two-component system sensor histidine kinase DegS
VLQTLGGTVFELEVLRRQLPEESDARVRLLEIQLLVVAQVSELRSLTRSLKPSGVELPVKESDLQARLRDLARRIERQWGYPVAVAVDRWEAPVSEAMAFQICHLVNEALVNAARHAAPTRLSLEVATLGGDAVITVADDGHGFSFQGAHDLKALDELNLGPLTLRHRVHSLGGDLSIDSTPDGSTLRILLPLAAAEV